MKRVAVMAGGYSGEHAISLKSAQTVMHHLDRSKYEPILIVVSKGAWVANHASGKFAVDLNDFSFKAGDMKVTFDFAFIMIHGTPGEDGKLQGYFDMIGLPYSSGSVMNMSLTFNKGMTQKLLKSQGFNVAEFVVIKKGEELKPEYILNKVGLPCFVKPTQAGSSLGISKVKQESEFQAAVDMAFEVDNQIIIESFLQGREITCGVVPINGKLTALPVTEIVYTSEFFDYEAKYNDKATEEITPAKISEDTYQRCQALAVDIYKLTQCQGIGRVDFFLCAEEDIYVVEVNTVPGMSDASIVPKMIRAAGLDFKELFTECITNL